MAAEEQTHREENQASASPESQVPSPARLDSRVKTSRPWDKFVALVALVMVSTAAILALLLYKNAFSTAKDLIILVESCLIVVGTIAGAYLGVRPARLTGGLGGGERWNEPTI